MPEQGHTEARAGIPLVAVAGDAGPPFVGLAFRVGRADETLPTSGITHVIEHLAMHALGRTAYEANAFVDPLRTVFHATGEPGDLVEFLRSVTRALSDLPLDRLEAELRVVRTEASGGGGGPHSELLAFRYGPRSYGLPAFDELGLRSVDAAAVRAWASRAFTRGNCALWTNVALPQDLDLALPDGPRLPPPEPRSVVELPARFAGDAALGVDAIGLRSLALSTGWRLLQARAFDSLRREHAVVYDVALHSERVGRSLQQSALLIDPLPDHRFRAGQLLARVLDVALAEGMSAQEVRHDVAAARRAWALPGAGLHRAEVTAFDLLVDRPPLQADELEAELSELTAARIDEALRQAQPTALYALPDEVMTSAFLQPVPRWSRERLPGRAFLPAGLHAAKPAGRRSLAVGPAGVTLHANGEEFVTVPYERCVALLAWDDGSRVLVGHDGFRVVVDPWEWSDGEGAVRLVDAAVPTALRVPMGEGEGPPAEGPSAGDRVAWPWLVVWALVSVFFVGFALTATEPVDAPTTGPLAEVGCGRTSLGVLLDGVGPELARSTAPGAERLREDCVSTAVEDVVFGAAGALSLVASVAVAGRRVLQRHRRRAGEEDDSRR